MSGFVILLREQGFNSFFKGWVPTLVGYSAQGACKFGLYEFFKKLYSDMVKHGHQSVIYLAASASAEMFADVMLCPLEAIKIRVQTQPGFAMGLCDGLPKFIKSDGALGYEYFVSCVFFSHFFLWPLLVHSTEFNVTIKSDGALEYERFVSFDILLVRLVLELFYKLER